MQFNFCDVIANAYCKFLSKPELDTITQQLTTKLCDFVLDCFETSLQPEQTPKCENLTILTQRVYLLFNKIKAQQVSNFIINRLIIKA